MNGGQEWRGCTCSEPVQQIVCVSPASSFRSLMEWTVRTFFFYNGAYWLTKEFIRWAELSTLIAMSAQNLCSQRKGDWRVHEKSEGLLGAPRNQVWFLSCYFSVGFSPNANWIIRSVCTKCSYMEQHTNLPWMKRPILGNCMNRITRIMIIGISLELPPAWVNARTMTTIKTHSCPVSRFTRLYRS